MNIMPRNRGIVACRQECIGTRWCGSIGDCATRCRNLWTNKSLYFCPYCRDVFIGIPVLVEAINRRQVTLLDIGKRVNRPGMVERARSTSDLPRAWWVFACRLFDMYKR